MQNHFVETKITTEWGRFNFRVYPNLFNKESIVLYTETLDPSVPVLVRIHSECITGETFKSLQCDCGKQLSKALKLINESKNGILIYLRQEGRGIGLVEKIKSYQLQQKGHDTFEANLMLGHQPDARTYDMVQPILKDLGVTRINLLTNNPSKISETAKSGIEVVERIPLVISANIHNKKYLISKKDKFKHFLSNKNSTYFYQFHLDSVNHIREISTFLRDKKRDPFLKIYVGVAANRASLFDEKEIMFLKSLFENCHANGLTPVLHFSFKDSIHSLKDIKLIKKKMPFVEHLQLNDLPNPQYHAIKLSCRLFYSYIPISDENFDLLYGENFRNLVKKHNAFILLDNSKGRGTHDSKKSFMKKIEILLNYGLNDIALYGGFGPANLDTYFELRRYYKINFSIGAQTKLKTDGQIDIEKVKLYLFQLIRFYDPKLSRIKETRVFLQQHKRSDWKKVSIEEKEFFIHPNVLHPGYFPSPRWLIAHLQAELKDKSDFCEIGCGSGIISCLLAMTYPKLQIVATDLSPFACENTRMNAEKFNLRDRIGITLGDVLDGIPPDSHFDTIFWALPSGFLDPGTHVNLEETQVFDPGYRAIRKFFQTAKKFLNPGGKLILVFSPDLGNQELLEEISKQYGIKLNKIDEIETEQTETIKFELLAGSI